MPRYQGLTNTKLMGLIYQSSIGNKLNLLSSTLIVLFALAYHWNTIRKDCFPSQNFISLKTGLSLSSVKRGIKELSNQGLIIKIKSSTGNNKYKFTNKFFDLVNCDTSRCQFETNTAQIEPYMIKHENKHEKEQTSSTIIQNNNKSTNDDDLKNTMDLRKYRKITDQLQQWNYVNPKQVIKKYGIEKIKPLIEFVENKNPENKGAYLRTLLKSGDIIRPEKENKYLPEPSNRVLNHIRYIKSINEPRLEKDEIINNLIQEGNTEEANTLIKLWKINY